MVNYGNGKIYKLVNNVNDKIYIGSTVGPLSKRFQNHKADSKIKADRPIYKYLNTIGWENIRIVLIESVVAENKEQLIQREQHYIDLLKPELNKKSAYVNCPHGKIHQYCKECHPFRFYCYECELSFGQKANLINHENTQAHKEWIKQLEDYCENNL